MMRVNSGSTAQLSGYLNEGYAMSFSDYGLPRFLAHSGAWVLERQIPRTQHRDAMGCYPIFCCPNWDGLAEDFRAFEDQWVSLVLVTDPFSGMTAEWLARIFDHVLLFKEHFVADLSAPVDKILSRRRYAQAQRALLKLDLEIERPPLDCHLVKECWGLYRDLVQRRRVSGMSALSFQAFEQMLSLPGTVVLLARYENNAVGMHVEYQQADFVYGHLAAYNSLGYRVGAAAALHVAEIEYFHGLAGWIDWGGAAGVEVGAVDCLAAFKRGFSNDRRNVYLCGRVFDREAYRQLAGSLDTGTYFPAYRKGEFR